MMSRQIGWRGCRAWLRCSRPDLLVLGRRIGACRLLSLDSGPAALPPFAARLAPPAARVAQRGGWEAGLAVSRAAPRRQGGGRVRVRAGSPSQSEPPSTSRSVWGAVWPCGFLTIGKLCGCGRKGGDSVKRPSQPPTPSLPYTAAWRSAAVHERMGEKGRAMGGGRGGAALTEGKRRGDERTPMAAPRASSTTALFAPTARQSGREIPCRAAREPAVTMPG